MSDYRMARRQFIRDFELHLSNSPMTEYTRFDFCRELWKARCACIGFHRFSEIEIDLWLLAGAPVPPTSPRRVRLVEKELKRAGLSRSLSKIICRDGILAIAEENIILNAESQKFGITPIHGAPRKRINPYT